MTTTTLPRATRRVRPHGMILEDDGAWWLVDFDPVTLHATLVDARTREERRVVVLKGSQRKAAREAMEGRRLRWAVASGRACYVCPSSRNYTPTFVGPKPEGEE